MILQRIHEVKNTAADEAKMDNNILIKNGKNDMQEKSIPAVPTAPMFPDQEIGHKTRGTTEKITNQILAVLISQN